jgi:hypothetical protein
MSNEEYVLVTTISHFRIKYSIPRKDFEALGYGEPIDTEKLATYIQAGNVKEFSQYHLGENVCDVAVYKEEDVLELFDLDNAYLAKWPTTQKIEWINRWKEEDLS